MKKKNDRERWGEVMPTVRRGEEGVSPSNGSIFLYLVICLCDQLLMIVSNECVHPTSQLKGVSHGGS